MKKNYFKRRLFTASKAILLAIGVVFASVSVKAQKTYNRVDSTSITGGILQSIRAQKMIFGAIDAPDNGKDQDLLIFKVGSETTSATLTFTGIELYKNNGTGTYSLNSSVFESLKKGNGAWSKTDGNIIINGLNASDVKTTILYTRDGSGNYIKVVNPVDGTSEFPGITGFAGFIDYNGDGKDDIFLADNELGTSYLYQNLGLNQYALVPNPVDGTSSFPIMILNSYEVTGVVFGDYNKDGKMDIAISARTGSANNTAYTSIYKNNGNGTFSKITIELDGVPSTNFTPLSAGSIDFGDMDSDGYATNIAVQGNSTATTAVRTVKVFKQDATDPDKYTTILSYAGTSTGQTTHQGGKRYGQMIFGDLEGAGFKKDLITTGQTATGAVTTEVFINKGAPTYGFTVYSRYGSAAYPVNTAAFASFIWDYAANSSYRFFAFGDIDGDGKKNDLAKFGVPANTSPAAMASLFVYNGTPLPVTGIEFNVKAEANGAKLTWSTVTEKDNSHFTISRSTDGSTFTKLTTVTGAGTSLTAKKYEFTDNAPANGINYYKLQQVDFNGTITDLGVKSLRFGLLANAANAYPNPTKGIATVVVSAGTYIGYTVVNVQGNTVAKGTVGTNSTSVDIDLSSLAAGTYIIKLTGKSGNTTSRIVKL
mgnify:CR=1 FL=1